MFLDFSFDFGRKSPGIYTWAFLLLKRIQAVDPPIFWPIQVTPL